MGKEELLEKAKTSKLNKKELKDLLIFLCEEEDGDLDLSGLDFSDFDGNIDISFMKVKEDLFQMSQDVNGDLHQDYQNVDGYLHQGNQRVYEDLYQDSQKVYHDLYQDSQDVKGVLYNVPKIFKSMKLNFSFKQFCEDEDLLAIRCKTMNQANKLFEEFDKQGKRLCGAWIYSKFKYSIEDWGEFTKNIVYCNNGQVVNEEYAIRNNIPIYGFGDIIFEE